MKLSLHYLHKIYSVWPTMAEAVMHKGKVAYFMACYYCDVYMKYFM